MAVPRVRPAWNGVSFIPASSVAEEDLPPPEDRETLCARIAGWFVMWGGHQLWTRTPLYFTEDMCNSGHVLRQLALDS